MHIDVVVTKGLHNIKTQLVPRDSLLLLGSNDPREHAALVIASESEGK